jgi:hypothetical protein
VVHINRLRKYDGDIPDIWKSASKPRKGVSVGDGNNSQQHAVVDAVQSTSTESSIINSGQSLDMPLAGVNLEVSDPLVKEACQPDPAGGVGVISPAVIPGDTNMSATAIASVVIQPNGEPEGAGHGQMERVARPQRTRHPPARFRRVYNSSYAISDREREVTTSILNQSIGMDSAADRMSGNLNTRQGDSRVHRRHREKGPWFCADCNHSPMRDITTFRRHVVRKHEKYCSWSGHVRPFIDQAEAERVQEVINRAGRRSVLGKRSTGDRSPAATESGQGQFGAFDVCHHRRWHKHLNRQHQRMGNICLRRQRHQRPNLRRHVEGVDWLVLHHRLQQLATTSVIIAGRHRLDHLRLRLALDQRMITVRHLLVLLVRHGMIINSHRLLDLTPSTMQVMLKINVVKILFINKKFG